MEKYRLRGSWDIIIVALAGVLVVFPIVVHKISKALDDLFVCQVL